jgi:hypothetical protein
MGQTTSFNKDLIKSNVLIMGENKAYNEARYIHSEFWKKVPGLSTEVMIQLITSIL